MSEKFKVGDYIIWEHYIREDGKILSMAIMRVVTVDINKTPFIYEIESILDVSYPCERITSGSAYRLVTEAEKILFLKDNKWTYK